MNKNKECKECQYLGDKFSFPMPNNKALQGHYCCSGDCPQYGQDIKLISHPCPFYENIDN